MKLVKPSQKTLFTSIVALFLAGFIGTANSESSNWIINNLGFAVDSFFHEIGHTITGWIFGYPSAPAFIVTWHFARSWIIQIIIFIILSLWCFNLWRKGSEYFQSALALFLIIIIISITGYENIAILYMGHGGAIVIGSYFIHKAWADKGFKLPYHQFIFAFAGYLLVIKNIYFCFMLVTNSAARSQYNNKHPFGMDNDFIRIAEQLKFLSVEKIAIITICLGIAALITPTILALYPKNLLASESGKS